MHNMLDPLSDGHIQLNSLKKIKPRQPPCDEKLKQEGEGGELKRTLQYNFVFSPFLSPFTDTYRWPH